MNCHDGETQIKIVGMRRVVHRHGCSQNRHNQLQHVPLQDHNHHSNSRHSVINLRQPIIFVTLLKIKPTFLLQILRNFIEKSTFAIPIIARNKSCCRSWSFGKVRGRGGTISPWRWLWSVIIGVWGRFAEKVEVGIEELILVEEVFEFGVSLSIDAGYSVSCIIFIVVLIQLFSLNKKVSKSPMRNIITVQRPNI